MPRVSLSTRIKDLPIRFPSTYRSGYIDLKVLVKDMGTIRIETEGTSNLARVYLWLSRHRGQVVQLAAAKQLTLGAPISGARAAIVAAVLEDDRGSGPQLGGVLRAVSSRTPAEPVRLVFEGRAPGGLARADAEAAAADLLHEIDTRIAMEELEAKVA